MNPLREAAQQALEALEKTHTQPGCEQWQAERKASVALRAALAQQEQEPVPAFVHRELVEVHADGTETWSETPLCAAQPRREWRGLTMQEINALPEVGGRMWNMGVADAVLRAIRAIEAALKEKNHE